MANAIFKENETTLSIGFGYTTYEYLISLKKITYNIGTQILYPLLSLLFLMVSGYYLSSQPLLSAFIFVIFVLPNFLVYLVHLACKPIPIRVRLPDQINLYTKTRALLCGNNEFLLEKFDTIEVVTKFIEYSNNKHTTFRLKQEDEDEEVLEYLSDSYQWGLEAVEFIAKRMGLKALYRIKTRDSNQIFENKEDALVVLREHNKSTGITLFEGSMLNKIWGFLLMIIILIFLVIPIIYNTVGFLLGFTYFLPPW